LLDSHLHVVDTGSVVDSDLTANPAGAWWEAIDASWQAVAERVRAAGVDGGVFVQAVAAHGFDPRAAREAADAAGEDWAAVAAASESDSPVLDKVAGLRLFSVPQPERPWLDGERGHALVEQCAAAGITPSVCCLPGELSAVARLAAAHLDTEIALDHAGFLDVTADETAVAALASQDNIVVKLSSGVFERASGPARAVVDALLAHFGEHRIAWGSDHPQAGGRSYAQLAAEARSAAAHLPAGVAEAILHRNCARLWFRPGLP